MAFFLLSKSSHAQASLETILVVAFVILVSIVILIPYVSNQNVTNVSIQAKSALLPYLEKNEQSLRLVTLLPVVSGTNLSMTMRTKGELDVSLVQELQPPASGCASLCSRIDPDDLFGSIDFVWENQLSDGTIVPVCSETC